MILIYGSYKEVQRFLKLRLLWCTFLETIVVCTEGFTSVPRDEQCMIKYWNENIYFYFRVSGCKLVQFSNF